MADIKWIKLSTDIFDNRKIRQIESMPEGDALVVIWLKLLILAGDVNDGGYVYFTKDIPYTDQLLATQFNRPLTTIQLALRTFQQFGMIEVIDDLICVSNWKKYQNIEGMERIREQTRKRVAKYREKQKAALVEDVTLQVTQGNATDKNKSKSKNKNKDNTSAKADYQSEFDEAWSIYPKKQGKKRAYEAYVRSRKKGVPAVQILNGVHEYIDYIRWRKVDEQFVKQGATFFFQEAWADEWMPKKEKDTLDGIL